MPSLKLHLILDFAALGAVAVMVSAGVAGCSLLGNIIVF